VELCLDGTESHVKHVRDFVLLQTLDGNQDQYFALCQWQFGEFLFHPTDQVFDGDLTFRSHLIGVFVHAAGLTN
jgi:hypothetical protein